MIDMQVIVYQTDANGVAVIYPVPEFAGQIDAVAAKDVPVGKAWRVMAAADLPPRSSRTKWRWTATGPLEVAP